MTEAKDKTPEPSAKTDAPLTPPASENQPDTPPVSTPETQLAAAKKETVDNYDRYLRAVADLENYRRRTIREKDEIRQYATSRVLEDMFPIIEAINLGIEAAQKPGTDAAHITDGMRMVLSQLKTKLSAHGLKEINPAPGENFDPHQEEAIAAQPSPDIAEGKILQVFRVGYALNDRVLRPAAVVVSNGKPVADAADAKNAKKEK